MELDVPIVTESPPVVDGTAQEAPAADSGEIKLPGYALQFTKEQQAALKEELKRDPKAIEKLPKGLPEFYDSWRTLSANQNAIKVPAKEATKEEWDQYYKATGRPDSADQYTLTKPNVPAEFQYSDAVEKWFKGVAFANNLPNSVADGIFAELNKLQVDALTKVRTQQAEAAKKAESEKQAKAQEAINTLKQKWGEKFSENWEGMRKAVAMFQTPGMIEKAKTLGLENDPDFLVMFFNIYTRIGPDKIVKPSDEGGGRNTGKPGFDFSDANVHARKE